MTLSPKGKTEKKQKNISASKGIRTSGPDVQMLSDRGTRVSQAGRSVLVASGNCKVRGLATVRRYYVKGGGDCYAKL
jgi:hypothetical protein